MYGMHADQWKDNLNKILKIFFYFGVFFLFLNDQILFMKDNSGS